MVAVSIVEMQGFKSYEQEMPKPATRSTETRPKSDLDILVEFEHDVDMGLLKFVGMENYLSDLLGVKVDLVEKSALKPRIGKHILKEVVYP